MIVVYNDERSVHHLMDWRDRKTHDQSVNEVEPYCTCRAGDKTQELGKLPPRALLGKQDIEDFLYIPTPGIQLTLHMVQLYSKHHILCTSTATWHVSVVDIQSGPLLPLCLVVSLISTLCLLHMYFQSCSMLPLPVVWPPYRDTALWGASEDGSYPYKLVQSLYQSQDRQ